jgi:hypothetical protein
MDMPTIRTSLGRGIPAVNTKDNLALFVGNVLENAHELTASQVTHLAPPKSLHTLHRQVFKEEMIKRIGQFVGKLEEPIAALIHDRLMDSSDNHLGFLPAAREFNFTRKVLLGDLEFSHSLTKVQRTFNVFSNIGNQESFHTKVEPGAVTRPELIALVDFFLYHKVEPEIAKTVPFDRDRLDVGWNIARLAEFVDHTLNANLVTLKQFPTCLLERERTILFDLLKAWGCGTHLVLVLEVAKEKLIAFVNALNNILNGLGTYEIPMSVLSKLLQLGDVLHQDKLVQTLASKLVVATMQGNAVVIDQPSDVDLSVQKLILFLAIELELVRPHRCNYTRIEKLRQVGKTMHKKALVYSPDSTSAFLLLLPQGE